MSDTYITSFIRSSKSVLAGLHMRQKDMTVVGHGISVTDYGKTLKFLYSAYQQQDGYCRDPVDSVRGAKCRQLLLAPQALKCSRSCW